MNIDNIKKNKDAPQLTVDDIVQGDENYFKYGLIRNDENLMEMFLNKYPKNTDRDSVIQKIRLIDLLNSTQLVMQRYKVKGNSVEEVLADSIINESSFDTLIANGSTEAVELIANSVKVVAKEKTCDEGEDPTLHLYSFASKYCYYHQTYALEEPKNEYPIFDSNLCKILPYYISGITKYALENVCKNHSYKTYKEIIEKVFEVYEIAKDDSRFEKRAFSMLDHYLWYSVKIGKPSKQKNKAYKGE